MCELQRRLRDARERAQVSQAELAQRSNVSRATIARLELGDFMRPQPKTLRELTRALNRALVEAGDQPMPLGWLRLSAPDQVRVAG